MAELSSEEIFQPLGGLDIEVIGGLVEEHEVRLGQQQLGQHEAVLLAAAEGLDRLLEGFAAEAQPLEHALDLVLQVVGVEALDFVLEVIVAGGQPLALGRVGFLRQGLGHAERFLLQGDQAGQGRLRFVPERAAGVPARLLFEVAGVDRRVQPGGAAVGLVLAGKNAAAGWSFRCRSARPNRSALPAAPRTSPRPGPARGRSACEDCPPPEESFLLARVQVAVPINVVFYAKDAEPASNGPERACDPSGPRLGPGTGRPGRPAITPSGLHRRQATASVSGSAGNLLAGNARLGGCRQHIQYL